MYKSIDIDKLKFIKKKNEISFNQLVEEMVLCEV